MFKEEEISIPGKQVTLEGRFIPGTGAGGVVITHPHPLFGGSMANNVVWTAVRAFQARGWATLRFNFRGVGRSTGAYGGGLEEVDDVAAALDYLASRTAGPAWLVGYSFGAYVAALAMLQGSQAKGAVLISPPIAFMDLAFLPTVPRVKLIIAGDDDDLCPLADLQRLLATAPTGSPRPRLTVLPGCDHFYGGHEEELLKVLSAETLSTFL